MTVTAASQRRRRQHRAHPLVVLLRVLIVLVLAVAVLLAAAVVFAPAPAVEATPVEPELPVLPAAQVDWPEEARAAGIGVVGGDGVEDAWQAWGSEESHPMASVTKLVTVMIVLEAHPLEGADRGPTITLDADDVEAYAYARSQNAPIAPVYEGMTVTQRDLIEWSLVDSAGNAIWSLANWAFGDIDAFETAASDWAERHGFAHTEVHDPAGLDARSVSSAADLTRIALMAVENPVVLSTIQLESVQIPGIGYAPNTNRILGQAGIDGGKTGTLKVWGRNLFVTAIQEIEGVERRVVGIVMGTIAADETDAAMLGMLESVWPNFSEQVVVPEGTVVAEYAAPWGARVEASTTGDLAAVTFGDAAPAFESEARSLTPGAPPVEVGTATLSDGSPPVTVRTSGVLNGPDVWWRLSNPRAALGWYGLDVLGLGWLGEE